MSRIQNLWDALGKSSFNTHIKEGEIDPRSADNILIAWPTILDAIKKHFPNPNGINILDFGCGTGGFCIKLNKLGYKVVGVDSSAEMINTAKKHSPSSVKYILGDVSSILQNSIFQIIVSIMTLQFIKNLEKTLISLINHLQTGGILLMADFNKEWVKECLKIPISFADFDSNENPQKGWKTFGDLKIPVCIRDSKAYDDLAIKNGLTKFMEGYPPFTQVFVDKYPDDRPKNVSEYVILGYKRDNYSVKFKAK